ncbi:MAG TPA: hypothetical protein VGI99_11595 [Gemmataceae bacterium]|jgi:uncharacterized delta-60 repeat protein
MACRSAIRPFAKLRLESLESREVPASLAALDPSFGTLGKVTASGAPFTGVALQPDGKIVAVAMSNTDYFVARYNPDGTLDTSFDSDGIKTIDFGGTVDQPLGVAIDSQGDIAVVGSTSKTNDVAIAFLNSSGEPITSFNLTGTLTVNLGGSADRANAVRFDASGNLVIAGSTGSDFAVMRVKPDGTLDSTFGTGGKVIVDMSGTTDSANALRIQSDGKIVAAGTNGNDFAVLRLNANGTLDTTFNTTGKETLDFGGTDVARAVAIQPEGKIVLAGDFGSPTAADIAVARLNGSNGSLDTSFGTGGKVTVDVDGADDGRAVQLQPDGKILVVGDTGPVSGGGDVAVIRLTAAGHLDTTFNSTGKATFDLSGVTKLDLGEAAALSPDGKLVIAGQGGGGDVDGLLIRVPVMLENSSTLAVGGPLNGNATIFPVDSSTGQYSSTTTDIPALGGNPANVRTAVGDVNGDGIPDFVMITGPGVPIRLTVVSGLDDRTFLVPPMDPFGGNFTGGGFVSVADFGNTGRDDVIVTPDQGGGPRVAIYAVTGDYTSPEIGPASGGPPGTVHPDIVFAGFTFDLVANFFAIDPNFRGGARTAAGDINDDGIPDLAVAAGFAGGPRVSLYNGATLFSTQAKLVNDFFAFDPVLRNGVYVAIGDVNGDGFGDLYFGAGPGGSPRVLGIDGKTLLTAGPVAAINAPISNFFVAGNQANRGGIRLVAKDVDGDGKADMVVGTGEGQGSNVRVYLGKNIVNTNEPAGFQDLNPFSSATFANGIYVG